MHKTGKRLWSAYCIKCKSMYNIIYYRRERLGLIKNWKDSFSETFETPEQLRSYFSYNELECLLCGAFKKNLGLHLRRTHNMSSRKYNKTFGIPRTKGLVGANLRQSQQKKGYENKEFLGELSEKHRHKAHKKLKGMQFMHGKATKEQLKRNKLKAVKIARHINQQNINIPIEVFCRECGKKLIRTKYGVTTWENRGVQAICKKCAQKIQRLKSQKLLRSLK